MPHATLSEDRRGQASADVLVQLRVRKDVRVSGPVLETPTHWITHGFDEDLNRAMKGAARALLDLVVSRHGLSRDVGYAAQVSLDV